MAVLTPSAVPAVKRALLTAFAARPALAGVQCSWAPPPDLSTLENTSIYLLASGSKQSYIGIGHLLKDEELTIHLAVWHRSYETDPQIAESRLWELVSEIAGAVTNDGQDETLAGTVQWANFALAEQEGGPMPDTGWAFKARIEITALARLGPASSPSVTQPNPLSP